MKDTNDTNSELSAGRVEGTRTVCAVVRASTHKRLRQLSAALDLSNAEIIDRALKVFELRVLEEQGRVATLG